MIATPHPDVLRRQREALLERMTTLTPRLPEGALPGFPTGRGRLKGVLEVHFPEPLAYGRFGEGGDPLPEGGWWERTLGGLRLMGTSPQEGLAFWLPPHHEEALTEALQSRHATLAGIASLARRLDLRPRPQDLLGDAAFHAAAWASGLTPAEREKGMRMVAGLFWSWLAALDPEMRPYRLRMPSAVIASEDSAGGEEIAFLKTNDSGLKVKVEVQLPPSWPSLLQGWSSLYWTSGEEPRAFRSLREDPPRPLGPMDIPSGWRKLPMADPRRGPHDWKAEFLMFPRALHVDWDEAAYNHWTIKGPSR